MNQKILTHKTGLGSSIAAHNEGQRGGILPSYAAVFSLGGHAYLVVQTRQVQLHGAGGCCRGNTILINMEYTIIHQQVYDLKVESCTVQLNILFMNMIPTNLGDGGGCIVKTRHSSRRSRVILEATAGGCNGWSRSMSNKTKI